MFGQSKEEIERLVNLLSGHPTAGSSRHHEGSVLGILRAVSGKKAA
jgi:hypothetical protein